MCFSLSFPESSPRRQHWRILNLITVTSHSQRKKINESYCIQLYLKHLQIVITHEIRREPFNIHSTDWQGIQRPDLIRLYPFQVRARDNKGGSCDNWCVEYWHKVWELYAGGLQGSRFAPWVHRVLPKAHLSAQTGTLFWNIFGIASTPFHYLWNYTHLL